MKGSLGKPERGSLYLVGGRWRFTYRIPGRKKRTERLGKNERSARKRAAAVSDAIAPCAFVALWMMFRSVASSACSCTL